MTLEDFKTHFEMHYLKKITAYLNLKRLMRIFSFGFVGFLYLGIFISFYSQNVGIIVVFLSLVMGLFFFLTWLYNTFRPQKLKDVLAYYMFNASKCFHGSISEKNDEIAKEKFLEECLFNIRKFSDLLENVIQNVNISLKLPDFRQLERLKENTLTRIYPLIKSGKNTDDDILLSLSKLFFNEDEYEKLDELNLTIEQTLGPPVEFQADSQQIVKQLKNNTAFLGVTSVAIIAAGIFLGIFALKYPISAEAYWTYVGSNAATVVGSIIGTSIVINVFLWNRRKKE